MAENSDTPKLDRLSDLPVMPSGLDLPARRQVLLRWAAGCGASLCGSDAWAGRQIEEPLSHAVRTALSAAVAAAAPPEPVLANAAATDRLKVNGALLKFAAERGERPWRVRELDDELL